MCLQPIKIRNRRRLVNITSFKPFIEVPCGKCPSCKKQKQDDAVVRAYYECKKATNFAYFDTLTYNNEHLPKYEGLPCFSREDITKFFKRLRIQLERSGFSVSGKLKYFLASEYGGLNGRPHYHVLFFSSVDGLTPQKLWKITRQCWKKGFNDPYIKINEHIVNSIAGLKYVAKYVTKDTVFEDKYKKLLCKLSDDPDKQDSLLLAYRSLCPFIRSSIHFGFDIFALVENDARQALDIGVPVFGANGKQFYKIPNYLKHLLFYETKTDDRLSPKVRFQDGFPVKVSSGTYQVKNDSALRYCEYHLDDSIANFGRSVRSLLSSASAYNVEVPAILQNIDVQKYSIYKLVYQGHCCPDDIRHSLDIFGYKNFYMRCLLDEVGDDLVDSPMIHYKVAKNFVQDARDAIICQTSHPAFVGLDDIDDAIKALSKSVNQHRIKVANIKEQQKLKTRFIYEKYYRND